MKVVGKWFLSIHFGLGGPTTATNSSACPRSGVICPAEALGLSLDIGTRPSLPDGVPGMETGPPSSGDAPGISVGVSSSSWIEGFNRSCVNRPKGGDSRHDPSWARASAASLSHRRI
jgi:hypothetical protein